MFDETYYQNILAKYPPTISKEQLYKLCHISKRMAKCLLDNGIIPCVNTGHATHKYTILTTDVIAYLRKREASPDDCRVILPKGKGKKHIVYPSIEYTPSVMKRYQQLLIDLLQPYPDLMTVHMVSDLTGYSLKTIYKWTPKGHMRWLQNGTSFYVPKEILIRHMMSEDFRSIAGKSEKHRSIINQLIQMTKKEETDNV